MRPKAGLDMAGLSGPNRSRPDKVYVGLRDDIAGQKPAQTIW